MKAHIGVDAECGQHGEENLALGERGGHKKNSMFDEFEKEGDLSVLMSTKMPVGGPLTEEQKAFNRMLSLVRIVVGHPFRGMKRQCGLVKVCHPGLAKNTEQIVM